MPRLLPIAFCAACTLLVATPAARANPFETYGFGARAIGMGGGFTAAAAGHEALHYNVAGLARAERPSAALGVMASHRSLDVEGAAGRDDWLALVALGLSAPLPLGRAMERRLFAGVAVCLPGDALYDMRLPDDRAPSFPLIGDRDRRLVATAGLAARIFDWWLAGVGVTVLPDVAADVSVDLRQAGGTNDARVRVTPSAALSAGMTFRPLRALSVGVAWRGARHSRVKLAPVRVDVASNLDPVRASIEAQAYAMPHQVALGVEWLPVPEWTVTADVTWSHFGAWQAASPELALCAPCPRDCSDGDCPDYCTSGACSALFRDEVRPASFRDTFAPRVGAEWRPLPGLAVRAGYGFVPSPVPAQTGLTSLIDGHRHAAALGAGWRFADLPDGWPRAIALDAQAQVQVMSRVGWAKSAADADGDGSPDNYRPPEAGGGWPTVAGSALMVGCGLDVRMEF
ncbi:MAG: TonB-dependent receptor [Deltaproteobacteria bacterium]|nr:TonB-dependent receptor [Deltaproteobacteria bacterium]